MKSKTYLARVGVGILFTLLALPQAWSIELITNGGFETSDFTGWTVTDTGSGVFEVTSSTTPQSGIFETPGPSEGQYYAVSSQMGPGTHIITQTFEVPSPASSVILTYDMFVQTGISEIIDPIGLDHTGPPNQHARVDILFPGADAFNTTDGVLENYYLGIDGMPPQEYVSYSFDITSMVGAGGEFQLRFAQTDNQGNFNQGVDNVSIDFTPVPEPSTLALAMIAGLAATRRRFR